MSKSSLPAFIDAVEGAEDPETLWHYVLDFFHDHEIEMVSYHHAPVRPGIDEMKVVTDGFPEEWVCHYIEQKLYTVDPIPELAARSTEPFHWKDVGKLMPLNALQIEFLKDLSEAVHGDGLGIEVFGPGLRNGYVGLGFGGDRPNLSSKDVREMQYGSQIAHLRYCTLVPTEGHPGGPLSGREREILEWVARGKSNAVISQILELSPSTVDTYLRRIYAKLGVNDRTTAAIRGLGSGLIKGAA